MRAQAAFDEFCNMARAQCSLEDILFFLKVSLEDLEAIFQSEFKASIDELYQSAKREGIIQLKQAQFQAAVNGDKTMLTLLGKEYLGQGKDEPMDEENKVIVMLPPLKDVGAKTGNE